MIPKKIHYCWFGGAEKPELIKHCIRSWKKKLPDYEIIEWNENNFDVNVSPFCREAYEAKKYAFVADYCRVFALATQGGVYMDADIIVLKSFDEFLKYSYCSCHEYQPWVFEKIKSQYVDETGRKLPDVKKLVPGFGIQSGVMMAEKESPFILECLDYYNNLHFTNDLGNLIVCRILSNRLEKYGYRYAQDSQLLNSNILIERPFVFANMTTLNAESYAWHLYYRSWGNGFSLKQQLRNRFTRVYLLLQLLMRKKFSLKLLINIIS